MKVDLKYERCESCKHFLQHYIFSGSTFKRTSFGHCINRKLNGSKVKNRYVLRENCEFWESDEGLKAERKESVKSVLADMVTHLAEIADFLRDDKE